MAFCYGAWCLVAPDGLDLIGVHEAFDTVLAACLTCFPQMAEHAPGAIDTTARCLVPESSGVLYCKLRKDTLWDKFFMEAPARQRQCGKHPAKSP
jgi:hypothetical protein